MQTGIVEFWVSKFFQENRVDLLKYSLGLLLAGRGFIYAVKMLILKPQMKEESNKSQIAQREEKILNFWRENEIFKKTLEKESPKGEFVFYDGPPFATGSPHYGHLLAGTMKDVIPRYKTMQGFHVPRKWGWDCHGLPIENLVEKESGLKSKKDIEDLGIEKFNDKARASVLTYDHVWKEIVPRTGRFVDMDRAYLTMDWRYSESIWWSFKKLHDKGLIYNGFKSMMLCPHCGTTLSNFEVAQGYKDITDISVYVKFQLEGEKNNYVLAWTTTPWTLPGNVALAVNPEIQYAKIKIEKDILILAKERLAVLKDKQYEIVEEINGKDLVGLKYSPIFPYYKDAELKNKENIYKIVGADFVTTTDGTGVVHIAPAFGEDDYNLSVKDKLPFIQHVGVDGKFKKEVTDFAGEFVKPKDEHQKADIEVIKYLAKNGTLFEKEKIVHSYPHCWRCDTPLLNYATSSWFVEVTKLRNQLVEENKKINWVPKEIGEGRFGSWLENARDWAISRSRYWGAPLPVWICSDCGKQEVVGSVQDIKNKTKRNKYFVIRHGEGEHNVLNVLSSNKDNPHHLTERGREEVSLSAQVLKEKNIDLIISSPFVRTKETAELVTELIAYKGKIETDERLGELNFGDFNLQPLEKYFGYYNSVKEKLTKRLPNGECINDVRKRVAEFLYEIDSKHSGKNILLVTHDGPASMIFAVAEGADDGRAIEYWGMDRDFLSPGQEEELEFARIPHNRMFELDLHRPFIDEISWGCDCGGSFKRVPEVFDTWYESGSMPFSSIHYPFGSLRGKPAMEANDTQKPKRFPADFIAEGQDQTRGWFYSMLVLSIGLFGQSAYKNVIVNGIVLAEDGQKMAKRLKNYPEVDYILDKYGADAMRYYLISSPAVHAEDLAFSEKGVDEVVKKTIMRLDNVCTFYKTYDSEEIDIAHARKSKNILDKWIIARLDEINSEITRAYENYELDRGARPVADFVDDLSTWYLRRSRERFKGEDEKDKKSALATTRYVLQELSKLIAPVMPFLAEDLYGKVKGENSLESVHLESWPKLEMFDEKIIEEMAEARKIVSVGLELRAKAGIKVRQPLSLFVSSKKFSKEIVEIIMEELNVKEVKVGDKEELNTEITPDLKREGQARELMRAVQDARKNAGLSPHDVVELIVETDKAGEELVKEFEKEIKKTAKLSSISFGAVPGEETDLGSVKAKISIKK